MTKERPWYYYTPQTSTPGTKNLLIKDVPPDVMEELHKAKIRYGYRQIRFFIVREIFLPFLAKEDHHPDELTFLRAQNKQLRERVEFLESYMEMKDYMPEEEDLEIVPFDQVDVFDDIITGTESQEILKKIREQFNRGNVG